MGHCFGLLISLLCIEATNKSLCWFLGICYQWHVGNPQIGIASLALHDRVEDMFRPRVHSNHVALCYPGYPRITMETIMTCWCNRCFHSFSGAPIGWSPTSHPSMENTRVFRWFGPRWGPLPLCGDRYFQSHHGSASWIESLIIPVSISGFQRKAGFFIAPVTAISMGKPGKSSRLNMAMDHHR